MIRLRVLGNTVKVTGDVPRAVHSALDRMMQFQPEGIQFSDKVKKDEWDGIIHLYRNTEFPTGLLERVEMYLLVEELPYEVVDTREVEPGEPFESRIQLREYQKPIVECAVRARSCLIPVATGGGKTIIAAEAVARFGQKATLWLVPSVEVLHQTVETLEDYLDCEVGWAAERKKKLVEGGGERPRVNVVTWQLASAGLLAGRDKPRIPPQKRTEAQQKEYRRDREKRMWWRSFVAEHSVLVCDEVHHYSADALYDVAMLMPSPFRIGLSGTMFRTDGSELKFFAVVGECVRGITSSELIKLGYLVPPKIHFHKVGSIPYGRRDRWEKVYREMVVQNEERNAIVIAESLRLATEGRRTLVLVSQLRHGKILKHLLDDAAPDLRYELVHASARDRKGLVRDFRAGDVPLMISTPIFDEGVDIPEIGAVVLAGAGKSAVKAVQRVGRGLRIAPGKADVVVVEFRDSSKFVYDHAYERAQMYLAEPEFIVTGAVPK